MFLRLLFLDIQHQANRARRHAVLVALHAHEQAHPLLAIVRAIEPRIDRLDARRPQAALPAFAHRRNIVVMIHAERRHRVARQRFLPGQRLVLRRGPALGRPQVDLVDAGARRAHRDLEAVVHDRRLVARIDEFGDVLGQTENLELAGRQPAARRELRQRVTPRTIRLAAAQVQRRGAAFGRQALANSGVLVDIVLVQVLDDLADVVGRQRFATADQRFREVELAVIRVVAEHADVGIAHQAVAHVDRGDQLAQHAPLAGHVGQRGDAFGDAPAPARPQPALAARRREAIDGALAIGFVLGRRTLQHVVQLVTGDALRGQSGQLEEQLIGFDNLIIGVHANARNAERAKLLEQRRGAGVGIVDQVEPLPSVNE